VKALMGFCLECGEVTAQKLCFECFSRFDILEADAEFEEYQVYIMKENNENNLVNNQGIRDANNQVIGEEE